HQPNRNVELFTRLVVGQDEHAEHAHGGGDDHRIRPILVHPAHKHTERYLVSNLENRVVGIRLGRDVPHHQHQPGGDHDKPDQIKYWSQGVKGVGLRFQLIVLVEDVYVVDTRLQPIS